MLTPASCLPLLLLLVPLPSLLRTTEVVELDGAELRLESLPSQAPRATLRLDFAVGRLDDPPGHEGSLAALARAFEARVDGLRAYALPRRFRLELQANTDSESLTRGWERLSGALRLESTLGRGPSDDRKPAAESPEPGRELRWLASGLAWGFDSPPARELAPDERGTPSLLAGQALVDYAAEHLARAGLRITLEGALEREEWLARVRPFLQSLPAAPASPRFAVPLALLPGENELYWVPNERAPHFVGALVPGLAFDEEQGQRRAAEVELRLRQSAPPERLTRVAWLPLDPERGALWALRELGAEPTGARSALASLSEQLAAPGAWFVASGPDSLRAAWASERLVRVLPTATERAGTAEGRERVQAMLSALGGLQRWAAFACVHTRSSIRVPVDGLSEGGQPEERAFHIEAWKDLTRGQMRVDTRTPSGSLVSDRVWPDGGERWIGERLVALPEPEQRRYRASNTVSLYGLLRDLARGTSSARVLGGELEILGPAGPLARLSLDSQDRPQTLTVPRPDGERQFHYEAFAESDGFVYPERYRQSTTEGSQTTRSTVEHFDPSCTPGFLERR